MNPLYIVTAFFDKIRMGIGLLLPILADAADFKNWNRWVRRALALLLLCVVLWLLYRLQNRWWDGLNPWLKTNAPEDLRPYFLCFAFMFVLAIGWVAYTFKKLRSPKGQAEFPDLDREWQVAVKALLAKEIQLNDENSAPPVFLVLGQSADGMDDLFRASGWKFIVDSRADGAHLRVYAGFDPTSDEPVAVFVTFPNATGWSYLCNALNGDTTHSPPLGSKKAQDATKTLRLSPGENSLAHLGLDASEEHDLARLIKKQRDRKLSPAEQARLRFLSEKGNKASQHNSDREQLTVEMNALERGERELRFVCELLLADRWPVVPLNGVLVLIPWAAAADAGVARVAANELAANLTTIRTTLGLHYPTIGLICDLETTRGFPQFRTAFADDQLRGRIGQRLPLIPAGTLHHPELTREGVKWLANTVLPMWILKALNLSKEVAEEGEDANRDLYRLLEEVHRRVPAIARMLAQVPLGEVGGDDLDALPLLGGCYLAGTGTGAAQQAFVGGAFGRLMEDQAAVGWAKRAFRTDSWYHRWTNIGYAAALALVALGVVLLVLG